MDSIIYNERKEAKRQRYKELAQKFTDQGAQKVDQGYNRLKQIPFGQPILVGHYSEKGDRNFRAKSCGMIDKGYELQAKGEHYTDKVERMENNTAISSDDPSAVEKLTAKLAKLETYQTMMKEDNASARKQKLPQLFASYQLTNNNANIRTIKQRIASLVKIQTMEAREDIQGEGYTVHEDKDENRIMFIFESIPPEATRDILKHNGFKWSPNRGAWVRQLNENGRRATRWTIEKIKAL